MGFYDIQINGVEVKATIREENQYDLLGKGISELKSRMDNPPVVGIDFKGSDKTAGMPDLLLLHVKDRCLIIQLKPKNGLVYGSLRDFLNDKSICFVGFKINGVYQTLKSRNNNQATRKHALEITGTEAEAGDLAASVLKNPSLQK
ncbi:OLC1v1017650C1 [Oldenlandia corymbosa var. corymbosa]|uniref:OLC1v1017650C1 n=1 Tax=Oldenlandia corymbosa var. corymbosa TaxID=529605 RepID=A0AAV1E9Y5_OLDCO|nr:OLC1v1017650C1 [Oldenlandia corymbosa var. corymbosa]